MLLKRSYKIAAGIILLLIAFRLALPSIVKRYVNKTLDELPGYTGHVADIDLALYRGAYRIDNLVLVEEKGNPKHPFLQVQETNLSIEWKSLFKGKLVGEVIMHNPRMNIVEPKPGARPGEKPTREHWTETLKDLMPITINRFVAHNGKLTYMDFSKSPDIDLHIDNMQLTAHNLANVEEVGNPLPSTVHVTGTSVGGGALKGDMRGNFLKKIPDFDLNMQLTQVNLTSINDFIKAYGKFDVERGRLDMYSKLKLKDGYLNGYIKPFFEEVKVLDWSKDKKEDGVLRAAWEAVAGLVTEALENQSRDQIATQVPISGNFNQPDTDGSQTLFNIFRHAFIRAFNKGLQNELSKGKSKEDDD